MNYYDLKYPRLENVWVATLGQTLEKNIDSETGKEDFSEQIQIASTLETWNPKNNWTPPPICLHFDAQGRKLKKADRIFHRMVGPFISRNAVEKMREFFEREGYLLPLDVRNSEEEFYIWWVPWVENSIDFDRSEKFPNGKTIKKFVFNDFKINGLTAFRPHYTGMYNPDSQGQVIVNEEFKKAWIGERLTGIEFKPF